MSIFWICLLFNIFIIAYFAVKKWKFVSATYSFALIVLTTITLLLFREEHTVSLFIRLFGENGYKEFSFALEIFSYGALLPYLAIELLTLIVIMVLALKTTEKLIGLIKKRFERFYYSNRYNKIQYTFYTAPVLNEKRKIYLNNCLILC